MPQTVRNKRRENNVKIAIGCDPNVSNFKQLMVCATSLGYETAETIYLFDDI